MKRSVYIVWSLGLAATVLAWTFILYKEKAGSSRQANTPPNRARSYGIGRYVTDIRVGWCNNDGHIIESNPFTDSLTLTVFLQNFDGWLLAQARGDQRLLPEDLKSEELQNYLSLVELRKSSRLSAEQAASLQTLQIKINHWMLHERSNLRLMIAGQVFETIPLSMRLRLQLTARETSKARHTIVSFFISRLPAIQKNSKNGVPLFVQPARLVTLESLARPSPGLLTLCECRL